MRDWDEIEREWKRKEKERKARGEKDSSPRHRKPDSAACMVVMVTLASSATALAIVAGKVIGR